jgi:pimeloyl-ACP methyl ester carboxylesterase
VRFVAGAKLERRGGVDEIGTGPRVVLVHGSGNATKAWDAQRELADRFTLVLPVRSGYPPGPPLPRIDFEQQAEELAPLLGDGAHLVGHSYGGVIALLIAARDPERVSSLAVSEPPAFGIATADPAVAQMVEALQELFGDRLDDPAEHMRRFLAIVGVELEVPEPMPRAMEAMTRAAMAERPPWEAEIPLQELRAAPFPKLVVSGGHHPAFDAVCEVLAQGLGAELAVAAGRGHNVPAAPGYNRILARFLAGA